MWEAKERFVVAYDDVSGPPGPEGSEQRPARLVVLAPASGQSWTLEEPVTALAFLGSPPRVLLQRGDALVEWDFHADTRVPSPLAAQIQRLYPVCFPAWSGRFLGTRPEDAIKDESAGSSTPGDDVARAVDAHSRIVLADFEGHLAGVGEDLVVDPADALRTCAVSSDGKRIAYADERLVGVYVRRGPAFVDDDYITAERADELTFDPSGAFLGTKLDHGIADEQSRYLVHDLAHHVSHVYQVPGIASLARSRVLLRDLWKGWSSWQPGQGPRWSGETMGDHPEHVSVSPTGRYTATTSRAGFDVQRTPK